jgi:hypothetical protein
MAGYRIPWVFLNERTSNTFTSSVLSAQVNVGRQTYMDVYNGGSLIITIKNQSNESSGFQMNDVISLKAVTGLFDVSFWVDEVQYNDYQGNTGLSTATIICSDAVARFGRSLLTNRVLTETLCTAQALELNPTAGLFPRVEAFSFGGSYSIASATVYSGAPMTRLNQLVNTERGIIKTVDKRIGFFSRGFINNPSSVDMGRTATSTAIGYEEFTRVALGQNFMNNVAVTPTGGAEQIASNAASVTAYGSNYYSVQSEDYTNAQALGLAQWLSNSQSDPTALRFEVGFTDRAQTAGGIENFLYSLLTAVVNLSYRVPGAGSDTTTKTIVEGFSVDITPSDSSWRVYFSPLTYYQFFTLNDATTGVLDTSRLGW